MSNSTSNEHACNPSFEQLEPRLLLSTYGTVDLLYLGDGLGEPPALYDAISIRADADRDGNYELDTGSNPYALAGEYPFMARNVNFTPEGEDLEPIPIQGGQFKAYCVDVADDVDWESPAFHPYTIVDAEDVVLGGTKTVANPDGRLLGAESAGYLREFFARHLLDVVDNATAAAFGACVWEIVYEDPGETAGDPNYDLTNGFLQAGNFANSALANAWLGELNGSVIGDVVVALVSDDYQDVSFTVLGSGGQEPDLSDLSGLVWEDLNDNGEVDFGEAGIPGATVTLTGTVNQTATTDSNGFYMFTDLPSGTYTITETQPTGFDDGQDSLGSLGGTVGDDVFSNIVLTPGSSGENYNFGELLTADGQLGDNTTATIGFWQNKNGQKLIKGLNGDEDSILLGQWLAATLPDMYGSGATYTDAKGNVRDMDLSDDTNADIAGVFKFLHKRNKKSAIENGGAPKVDAQVLGVALATYVTSESLIGLNFNALNVPMYDFTDVDDDGVYEPGEGDAAIVSSANIGHVQAYGFSTSADGIGYQTFDVLSVLTAQEAADLGITLDTNGNATILDILQSTNAMSSSGLLYDVDDDGIDSSETVLRKLANELYTAINEAGDI